MAGLAAAADRVMRTVRPAPGGRGRNHSRHAPPEGGFTHLEQLHIAELTRKCALNKDGLTVQMSHTLALAAIALYHEAVNAVFFRLYHEIKISSNTSLAMGNSGEPKAWGPRE
ncbi:hypothetical protein SDC9_66385 [bioreactor metagenome]|uniref:Uncharacterized protein n=1 Tax=bioreactor metagenome TaxID=1076179 RepID=A0A644XW00_9ZZZZ